jgi:hypothetical protein
MREARMKPRLERDSSIAADGAKPTPRSFVAQLLGGLLDWRRREAERTIRRYDALIAQAGDPFPAPNGDAVTAAPIVSAGHPGTPLPGFALEHGGCICTLLSAGDATGISPLGSFGQLGPIGQNSAAFGETPALAR